MKLMRTAGTFYMRADAVGDDYVGDKLPMRGYVLVEGFYASSDPLSCEFDALCIAPDGSIGWIWSNLLTED